MALAGHQRHAGLLFTGLLNGEFIALDQDTGQTLWVFKTGSTINSPPITYTYQGRQFVTCFPASAVPLTGG
jgi:alcohol dehydrogenase (cytochrome c)